MKFNYLDIIRNLHEGHLLWIAETNEQVNQKINNIN